MSLSSPLDDDVYIDFLPTSGKKLHLFGVTLAYKVEAKDTDGAWSLVEYTMPPQFAGPSRHIHRNTDEAIYVLEGHPIFHLGDQIIDSRPGFFTRIARGEAHSFSNPKLEAARILIHFSPAGFEQYWEELAELAKGELSWPPRDMTKIAALMAKYDQFPAE